MFTSEIAVDVETPFPSSSAMNAAYCELLQLRHELGDTPEFLAAIGRFAQRGQATGKLLDDPAARRAAQSQIDYWANVCYRVTGAEIADTLLVDFDESTRAELPESNCPYVGMDAFSEGQASFFFGRTELVDALVAKLREHGLIALVGSSGCGKSSVLFAGLLPRLRLGALIDSEHSPYVLKILPGSRPLTSLAEVVNQCAPRTNGSQGIEEIVQAMRTDPGSLGSLLRETRCVPAIMVVDQFEEIFTLCPDVAERDAFIGCLISLLDAPCKGNRVILTLRVDFLDYAHTTTSPEFQALIKQGEVLVSPLNPSELRDAIEKPAERAGLVIEPEVVKALVDGLRTEPAALPLLQFTLLKLWEKRERNRVTYRTYRDLGGWKSVLGRSAEEAFTALTPQDQEAARLLYVTLVKPGSGEEYTRKRMLVSDLHNLLAPDRVDHVIDKFVEARLLHRTSGASAVDDQVEVAHEALIRNWSRYHDWLREERDTILRRGDLEAAAKRWAQAPVDQRAEYLWKGARLAGVESLPDLSTEERAFIDACNDAYRESVLREERRKQAIEHERKTRLDAERRADDLRKNNQRYRRLAIFCGILCLGLIFAIVYSRQTQLKLQRARGESLARLAQLIAERGPYDLQRATLLATEAVELSRGLDFGDDEESLMALRDLLERFDGYPLLVKPADSFGKLAFAHSPRRELVAAADAGGSVYLWDLRAIRASDGQQSDLEGTRVPLEVGKPLSLDFGSNLLAVGGSDGAFVADVREWPPGTITSIPAEAPVSAVAVSPDDAAVALTGSGGRLELFALESGSILSPPRVLGEHQPMSGTLEFSPDGRWLALVVNDKTLRLWDIRSTVDTPVLDTAKDGVVAFSPDGHWLAARTAGGEKIQIWDLRLPRRRIAADKADHEVLPLSKGISTLIFNSDSKWLIAGSDDGRIMAWEMRVVETGKGTSTRNFAEDGDGYGAAVTSNIASSRLEVNNPSLFFGIDGRRVSLPLGPIRVASSMPPPSGSVMPTTTVFLVATSNPDGTVSLWSSKDPSTSQGTYASGLQRPITRLVFGQSSDYLLAQAEDGSIRMIDLEDESHHPAPPSEELQKAACLTVGRYLTEPEKSELDMGNSQISVCERLMDEWAQE